jgi:hypothetical protein
MSKFAFAWRCYADLQQHALQSHRIGDCSWGLEQGLDYLIAAISSDTVPVNPQILEANLKRAMASSSRLERAHSSARRTWLQPRSGTASIDNEVEASAALNKIAQVVTGSVEQQILFKTGLGYSDAEIAHEFASTPNAIRIRLLRLRRKLAA